MLKLLILRINVCPDSDNRAGDLEWGRAGIGDGHGNILLTHSVVANAKGIGIWRRIGRDTGSVPRINVGWSTSGNIGGQSDCFAKENQHWRSRTGNNERIPRHNQIKSCLFVERRTGNSYWMSAYGSTRRNSKGDDRSAGQITILTGDTRGYSRWCAGNR